MARRRHTIRNRKKTKYSRTRSKRGGEGTPQEEKGATVTGFTTFYNPNTLKKKGDIQNAQFYDPSKMLPKMSSNISQNPGILRSDDISAEEVFSKPAGYYSKESIAQRNRTLADEEYNKLMSKYKPDVPKKSCEEDEYGEGCVVSGGRKRKRRSRKTRKIPRHRSKY